MYRQAKLKQKHTFGKFAYLLLDLGNIMKYKECVYNVLFFYVWCFIFVNAKQPHVCFTCKDLLLFFIYHAGVHKGQTLMFASFVFKMSIHSTVLIIYHYILSHHYTTLSSFFCTMPPFPSTQLLQ